MNTIPRLFNNPSWQTIASFSLDELIEFSMLMVLSIGLIAIVAYWIVRGALALWRRR